MGVLCNVTCDYSSCIDCCYATGPMDHLQRNTNNDLNEHVEEQMDPPIVRFEMYMYIFSQHLTHNSIASTFDYVPESQVQFAHFFNSFYMHILLSSTS